MLILRSASAAGSGRGRFATRQPAPVLGFPAGSPGEVGLVGGLLLGLRLLELLLTAAQPFPPRPNVDQLGRQLIATYLPEPLIFGGVRIGGFGEHPVDLQADRCVTARRAWRGAAREQAAVERDHAHRHQPGRAHNASTCVKVAASACSCRPRKRATVA